MQPFKTICLCLLLLLTTQNLGVAKVAKLSIEDRKILASSVPHRQILETSKLPPEIVALCADSNLRLAEPGQKWESTDYIIDSSLPRRRLIWAVVKDKYYVVHYESGGRGHSFQILIATTIQQQPKVIWQGGGFARLKNYKVFVDTLQRTNLDDRI